jgi:hypothetical protein
LSAYKKIIKTNLSAEDGLQINLLSYSKVLAIASGNTVTTNSLKGLWDGMQTLASFGLDFLAHYYAYLVENPLFF